MYNMKVCLSDEPPPAGTKCSWTLFEPIEGGQPDEYMAILIDSAGSEKEAREIAHKRAPNSHYNDPQRSICRRLIATGEPGIPS